MPFRLLFFAVALCLLGCAGMPRENNSPQALAAALQALSPTVRPSEARRAAETAYAASERLKHEYRIVGPAVFHNGLVNLGLRDKGLCYHWTEDLLAALRPLQLKTLTIHWAIAHPGNILESNALVLTARGQPLKDGIVLDGWRHAGRLYWTTASNDHSFPWQEDNSEYARARMTGMMLQTSR